MLNGIERRPNNITQICSKRFHPFDGSSNSVVSSDSSARGRSDFISDQVYKRVNVATSHSNTDTDIDKPRHFRTDQKRSKETVKVLQEHRIYV